MNILVDGYWWAEGPMSNRMVLQEIVRRWATDYPNDQMILAVPRDAKGSASVPDGVEVVSTRLRVHPAINFLELPVIARHKSADTILAFNFAANSTAGVVFLHDVLFQSNPEWFTAVERAYFSAMPLLARRARSVITTSQSERGRIRGLNPRLRRVVELRTVRGDFVQRCRGDRSGNATASWKVPALRRPPQCSEEPCRDLARRAAIGGAVERLSACRGG